jgi:signal transduction histidine kinase
MKIAPARRWDSCLEAAPLVAAVSVAVTGGLVLMGWYFRLFRLHDFHPALGTMGATTAFCFVLAGSGLGLLHRDDAARWRRNLGWICAGVVVLLSVTSLVDSAFGWKPNLDHWLFDGAIARIYPGRMPWATASAFLSLGLALLLLDLKARFHPAEIGACFAMLIVLLALVAYGYGNVSLLLPFPRRPLAFHTLLALLALSAGILTARPRRGLVALLRSPRIDGVMIRRLLPAAVGMPVAVGWLVMEGQRMGWYPAGLNAAYYTIVIVVLFTLLVLVTASTLRRIDLQRLEAEREIQTLNAELELRVVRRTAELEVANHELEAFSDSVSHDLRAPLRHVQGYLSLLEKEVEGHLTEKSRRYLSIVANAGRKMNQLIDDLLSFSKMGRTSLRETLVAPADLVEAVRQELELVTRGRNIRWVIAPLPVAKGDPAMLKQVFANLLGNAVKYSRGRDPAEIEVGCAGEENGRLVIYVRDNGVGFDMTYADKLFGVFQRLHHAEEFEGTGVGLATVRRIINRHGGRIWAESRPGAGAAFFFTLQLPIEEPAAVKTA